MGNPIAHSLSPQLHHAFAEQFGLAIQYRKIEVPLASFAQAVAEFTAEGGCGLNITAPFKHQAFLLASTLSEAAQQAQAVNTLVFDQGRCQGENTDGLGFMNDLSRQRGCSVADKTVVIHGAGGAVGGILPALLAAKPRLVYVINRSFNHGQAVVERFAALGPVAAIAYDQALADTDLLINATSLACDDFSGLQGLRFHEATYAYDLNYALEPTAFLRWAQRRGIRHYGDGFGMLVEQAALSFYAWTQHRPNTTALRDKRVCLGRS